MRGRFWRKRRFKRRFGGKHRFVKFVKWCLSKSKDIPVSKVYYRKGRFYTFTRVGNNIFIVSDKGTTFIISRYGFIDAKGQRWFVVKYGKRRILESL